MEHTRHYRQLIQGQMPPWVHRFIKQVGRTVNTCGMIKADDRVLLAASGGKDSLALALALSLRRKWLPVDYTLEAVLINWREHPIPPQKLEKLQTYFTDLSIDLTVIDAQMYSPTFKDEFNCYLCARNRRRILFQEAERRGIWKIALGHHLDDLVETSLINLCFRSDFSTMQPVQEFFSGKLYMIRPLIQLKEERIIRLEQTFRLPTAKPVCPFDQTNIRSQLKPVISRLSEIDRLTREHIFNAHQFTCRIPQHGYEDHRSFRGHDAQETDPPSA